LPARLQLKRNHFYSRFVADLLSPASKKRHLILSAKYAFLIQCSSHFVLQQPSFHLPTLHPPSNKHTSISLAHLCGCTPASAPAHIRVHARGHMHAHARSHTHTHANTHTHAVMHTHARTRISCVRKVLMHDHVDTCTNSRPRAPTHALAHTRSRPHTLAQNRRADKSRCICTVIIC
jgi:hypothetical protein